MIDFNNAAVAAIIGAVIAGLISAVMGWRQNKRTDRANRIADEALEIAKQANEYQEHVDPRSYAPWSRVEHHEKYRYFFTNETSRPAWVDELVPTSDEVKNLLHADANVRVDPGDMYSFLALQTFGGGIDRVTVKWHWDGEEEIHEVRREVLS